jgi:hypothetical protein
MYDYFYGQWGTFFDIPALASTLYQSLHTYINSFGQVFQETPGLYLDGSNPVLMSFTTSWISFAGVSGYGRLYDFYLLGTYYTPHKLQVQVSYNFSPGPAQSVLISPDNYNAAWGGGALWGSNPPGVWGGIPILEQYRVQPNNIGQQCQSFQITINEVFDGTYGVPAGAGFTMSGINMRLGIKKSTRPIRASHAVG